MKKRFLPLSMLLITMVLAQASLVANAAGIQGKYTPRTSTEATFSSFMKSIRANQETGLIDPADLIAGQKAAQTSSRETDLTWSYAGPDNFGGMTRAIVYNNDGTVLIGTMGGDIFKTTNGGITFKKLTNVGMMINCMAKDANGNIYIGTGDGREAQNYNGLSVMGYETSFIGKGIYKMAAGSTEPELLASTTPSATNGWGFVNEIAIANGNIYAATAGGIMKSSDNGASWTNMYEGNFRSVKTNGNGDILAADDANVYLSKNGAAFVNISDDIETNSNPKVIAMSPSDANYMYIAYMGGSIGAYTTGNIYFTTDGGNTWEIALAGTSLYPILSANANMDGFMIVYPNNPKKLLIGSNNLWVVEDSYGLGVNSYRPLQISEYFTDEFTAVAWNRYLYLHQGIQTIAFNPNDANMFFVGTNGGVYKGEYYANLYSYKSCNRYFITEEEHTSVTRMMSVGTGGLSTVLCGSLDHGTFGITGSENINNVTTGSVVFPHVTNNGYASSYFSKAYAGGPCAISTVNPDIYFVSATGSLSTPIYRSETAGVDYDGNFEGDGDNPVITNANAFRTPFAFFETYNDDHHSFVVKDVLESYDNPIDTVYNTDTLFINDSIYVFNGLIIKFDTITLAENHITLNDTLYQVNDTTIYIFEVLHDYLVTTEVNLDTLSVTFRNNAKAGDQAVYYSEQTGYPLFYTLPEPPHDPEHVDPNGGYMWTTEDTITGLHDPIKSNYVVAIEGKVYMTRDALIFNKPTEWFQMDTITGIPSAVTISADGTTAYVGTIDGKFYTFNNIDDAFSAEQADVTDILNVCVTKTLDKVTFAGRAITSIAVNPTNNNDVLVTLGNYGNTNYVYISHNAGESFTAMTGVPAAPVYSGIIEKSTGNYIIGTEYGIYTSENGTAWVKTGDVNCPVMDIKQAIMPNHDDITVTLYDEMGNPSYVVYPGINNEGMIYAATYGAGIISSASHKEGSDFGLEENDMTENVQVNIYPNPVRDMAQMNITLTEGANVSYQIYDLSGRMVANSELGFYGQGEHTMTFNAQNLTSGTYIIRVIAGNKAETAKFLVY